MTASQYEGLTLERVGRGHLEEQFQEALAEATEIFGRAHDGIYQPNKDKELRVTISISVELVHSLDAGTTIVYGGLDRVKRPARVRRGTQAFLAGGGIAVEKAKQVDLFEKEKE